MKIRSFFHTNLTLSLSVSRKLNAVKKKKSKEEDLTFCGINTLLINYGALII
jgi:hypothetical protein